MLAIILSANVYSMENTAKGSSLNQKRKRAGESSSPIISKKKKYSYICPAEGCQKGYDKPTRLKEHFEQEHKCQDLLICPSTQCTESFTSTDDLKDHIDGHNPKFRCPVENCLYFSETKRTFDRHLSQSHPEFKVSFCKVFKCGEFFMSPEELRDHLTNVHGCTLKCIIPECNELFSRIPARNTHIRKMHSNVEVFWCNKKRCIKPFIIQTEYLDHLKTHRAGGELKCPFPQCNQTVVRRRQVLEQHIESKHSQDGEVFWCDRNNCLNCFLSDDDRKEHMDIFHRDEADHICPYTDECQFKTNFFKSLRHHVTKMHEGFQKCRVKKCAKIFKDARDEEEHFTKDHEDYCYPCNFDDNCQSVFKKIGALKIHYKKQHGVAKIYPCPKENCANMLRNTRD